MKYLIFLGATALASISAHGQEQLMMYPTFGGAHFEYQKDTAIYQITPRQVGQILFDNPAAYKEFKKARTSSTISGIMGFLGAGMLIVPAATAVAGGDPEWTFVAGGAALVIGSIPISINYRRRAQKAIDLFNKQHSALRPRTKFYVSGRGAALLITF